MSHILKVQNISKSFINPHQKEINILKNISFELNEGESIAILGSSGSGKSTLLSLLTGLDYSDSGHIFIKNQDITKMNEKELSLFRVKHIGIIFQQFYLVNYLNALENVSLPMEFLKIKNHRSIAEELLKKVQIIHRKNHLPKHLSGGEIQRVAIARALSLNPAILIADEPTGSLDNETSEIISRMFFDLIQNEKMSAIIVTHNEKLASKCKRVLTLSNGNLS